MITHVSAVRTLIVVSAIVATLLVFIVSAGLTNWGRYPLSLESESVIVPMIGALIVALAIHLWAFRAARRSWVPAILAVAAFFAVTLIAGIRTRAAFGEWFVAPARGDIDRSADQVLRANGDVITYHLELRNPFSKSAETYIAGNVNGSPFRIRLPIGRISAYGAAADPADWLVFSGTSKSDVLARVTVDPSHTYTFVLDLKRQAIVATAPK